MQTLVIPNLATLLLLPQSSKPVLEPSPFSSYLELTAVPTVKADVPAQATSPLVIYSVQRDPFEAMSQALQDIVRDLLLQIANFTT